MGCGPSAPVRPLTPEEKIAKEKREFVATMMLSGLAGVVALFGVGQLALQFSAYRNAARRPKQPWEE